MSNECPRRYTLAELEAIARSIGLGKLGPLAVGKLQEAVTAYQWGCSVDYGKWGSPSTNKGRRRQLDHIINLCEQGASVDEIERAVNELDALAFPLLGRINTADHQSLRLAAEAALRTIPTRGPDPKRARRQFIGNLACLFALVTGQLPGRRVHDQESGPFLDFVKAALKPFKATMGCEADIKAALKGLKAALRDKRRGSKPPRRRRGFS